MGNAHSRTWNKERKLKIIKNEKHTLLQLKYGKKHCKPWKMRNAHCRTWIMVRKLKIIKNEQNTR